MNNTQPITTRPDSYPVKQVADRIDGMSERELFHWLRDAGWIGQNNSPTFIAKQRRLLVGKMSNIENGPRKDEPYMQPLFTRLGANTAVRLITYKERRQPLVEQINNIGQAMHSNRINHNNKKTLEEQFCKIHNSVAFAHTAIDQGNTENAEKLLANAIACIAALCADKKLNHMAQQIISIAESIKTSESTTHQQEQQP